MDHITLIFPHQLFLYHPAVGEGRNIYLVEECLFFTQYNFHKVKLCLHRASLMYYKDLLAKDGYHVTYISATDPLHDVRQLIRSFPPNTHIHAGEPYDYLLKRRILKQCKELGYMITWYETPYFINNSVTPLPFFQNKKKYFQTAFYKEQRIAKQILIDGDAQPTGGKWSFDEENRKKFPNKLQPPPLPSLNSNQFIKEAKVYVQTNFKNNYGELDEFNYPVTHEQAASWLSSFIIERFRDFGIYEDAMLTNNHTLHHSILSPLINIGLIEPAEVLRNVLHKKNGDIPINSLEGFVRQIMSWREFIYQVYNIAGVEQRTKNYWGFTRKIPASFWSGTTGILPIDTVIREVLRTGYCHHIERLMVLGSFMVLCEFDPDEVYKWFMEMFVDSYDWVMVPNVYGMSQFADGGLMTTKPYISGSNYILKMSNYKKGEWCKVWDGLFWRFMAVHRDFFSANPRLSLLINSWDKMTAEQREIHIINAEDFLGTLRADTNEN